MRRLSLCSIAPLLLVSAVASASKPTTPPTMTAPTLSTEVTVDGAIEAHEWKGAAEFQLASGVQLRAARDAKGLVLSVQSVQQGVLTVFLEIDKRVVVLHSSARVGTAVYEDKGGHWEPTRSFEYDYPTESFLAAEGWTASVVEPRQPGNVECRITEKLLGKQKNVRVRVAFSLFRQNETVAWPDGAEDDSVNGRLLLGHSPENLLFKPTTWGQLNLSATPKADSTGDAKGTPETDGEAKEQKPRSQPRSRPKKS